MENDEDDDDDEKEMKEREAENDARIGTGKAIWLVSATKLVINTLSALLIEDGKKALEIHSCKSCNNVTLQQFVK